MCKISLAPYPNCSSLSQLGCLLSEGGGRIGVAAAELLTEREDTFDSRAAEGLLFPILGHARKECDENICTAASIIATFCSEGPLQKL
jgi:hypothetical protein